MQGKMNNQKYEYCGIYPGQIHASDCPEREDKPAINLKNEEITKKEEENQELTKTIKTTQED